MSYQNLGMVWKVVSLLLVLGIVSLCGAFYATSQMRTIDTTYAAILDGPSIAVREASRANRAVVATSVSIYRNISANTDAENKAAVDAMNAAIANFDAKIETASRLAPNFASKLKANASAYHDILDKACAETLRLANDSDPASMAKANTEMQKSCEPALDKLGKAITATNDEISAELQRTSDIATAMTGTTILITLLAICGATIVVIVSAVFLVRSGIVAPIRSQMTVMTAISHGNLSLAVDGTDRKDEIGSMAKTLEIMRGQLIEAERARIEQASAETASKAQTARRERLANDFVARMQSLASGFARSSGEVAMSAKNLSATAEETSRQAQSVGAAAEEAASNIQTVAASSEELSASVREITGQVAHSAKVAEEAFHEAESSNIRIATLATAASAIGDVVNLIKGIADQTNLLALNATIEAARAGEAGRGFAVVASEVKQLASQTGKATDEIANKIGEIQQATNGTVNSMREIARTIANVKEIASSIAGAVEQQGAATGEIAQNCQQAAQGASEVTQSISGVGRAAEMTGSASTQLMSLSDGLSTQAEDLRKSVQSFVDELKAA